MLLWGLLSCIVAMIGRIRKYGITGTQNLSRCNSAIRIFVDLTPMVSPVDTCVLSTSPSNRQSDILAVFSQISDLR